MNEYLESESSRKRIQTVLSKLNGSDSNFFLFTDFLPQKQPKSTRPKSSKDIQKITYNLLNELQITFGYRLLPLSFFTYLLSNHLLLPSPSSDSLSDQKNFDQLIHDINCEEFIDYQRSFSDLDDLNRHVDIFRKHALLYYGNIGRCLNVFTESRGRLLDTLELLRPDPPIHFTSRPNQLNSIKPIPAEKTYYLGYLVQKEIQDNLTKDPNNQIYREQEKEKNLLINNGIYNYKAYLSTDILDVYIATSMREKEDYYMVNKHIQSLFNLKEVSDLHISYFDPTQAYCSNRIDKGLSEALMLKKAICTIYFIQENDTFGKDSELASTLAQGKPVIAFLPFVDDNYFNDLLNALQILYAPLPLDDILLMKIKCLAPELAWENEEVRQWIFDREKRDIDRMKSILMDKMKHNYDKRYDNLQEKHPLGLQVNIFTGVANGVLVVRTIEDCAKLLNNVLKSRMEYTLCEPNEEIKCVHLRENISNSIYRVATNDFGLTNAFWNYYTD